MGKDVFYLETHSVDPAYNLAFEEYVLTHCKEQDYLILWQNDRTVVVGQNQNAEVEIHRAFIEEHDIRVVRRTTGGGAVYHDLGNLNYSFITDVENSETLTMDRFTLPVVNALRHMGLQAEASGRNDILVAGHKVSGTAQRVIGGRILHHGTLLFHTDPAMIASALHVDPDKFRSRAAKSVRSRVGNIADYLPEPMDINEFWQRLRQELLGSTLCQGNLPDGAQDDIAALKTGKYDTWEWTFGRSPQYNMVKKGCWEGGILEICATVENGHIADISFYGDFLSTRPLDALCDALIGCSFRCAAISDVLQRFRLSDFFGSITGRQILETMFY